MPPEFELFPVHTGINRGGGAAGGARAAVPRAYGD